MTAWYSVVFCNCGSLFGYSDSVDASMLISASLYLIFGLGFFLLGSFTLKLISSPIKITHEATLKKSFSKNINMPKWQIRIVLFVLASCIFMLAYNLEVNGMPTDLSDRIFESKLSPIFLLILAYIGFESCKYTNTNVVHFMIVAVSMMVIVIDASRSGLIPLAGIFLGALSKKRIALSLFLLYLMYCGVGYSIGARIFDNRFDFEVIYSYFIPDFELLIETFKFGIDYIFSFSVLNFSYMAFLLEPQFSLAEILISINPAPSFVFDDDAMSSLKLAGDVRAIGSPAELFIAGKVYFLIGFFVIGVLSRYIDMILEGDFKFIILLIFSLSVIIFFQYSLRTYSRFFQLLFLIAFISKWKIKKG